jgi:riboflavin synthase
MFTGIVEGVGSISRLERVDDHIELDIEVPPELCDGVRIGDSVAIDGCCLTATACEAPRLSFQAVPETLRRTSLGQRESGAVVNVERAMRADARLDGHIVQGHVDGVGQIEARTLSGDDVIVRVSCKPEFAELLVEKGSVAIDGVSLTVVDAERDWFSVALIPHTLAVTTLGQRQVGDRVNLEADVVGKYVHAYLRRLGAPA